MDTPDRRKPRRLPVLIANGFAPFPLPLHVVREQYRALGFATRVVPFRLDDMRDVETYARHIAKAVRMLQLNKDVSRVNILGYSMGGVAALYAIKRLGLAPDIGTFVGLGSPFNGSRFSWFAVPSAVFSHTGLQLVPDSPFLKALLADPLPPGPRYVCVAGTNDLICPPDTATLPGAERHELPIGHAQFLIDERVPALVAPLLR